MARKKAIAQSVAATKAKVGALDRPLIPKIVSAAEVAAETIAKLMYAGQWDSTSRDATLKELGCSLQTFAKYERDAQRLVRLSMRHSGKAFERLAGVLNEVIDRSLEGGDLRTTVMAAGKLADITGLNKQVIEHREGDKLEEFRRRAMAGEDVEQLAREATEFILGVESGVMYQ